MAFCTFAGILASFCNGLFLCRVIGKTGNMWETELLTNFAQPLGKLHISFPTTTVYECRIHSGAKCNPHTTSLRDRSLSSRPIAFLHFSNSFGSLGARNRLQLYLQLLYPVLQPGTKHLLMSINSKYITIQTIQNITRKTLYIYKHQIPKTQWKRPEICWTFTLASFEIQAPVAEWLKQEYRTSRSTQSGLWMYWIYNTFHHSLVLTLFLDPS